MEKTNETNMNTTGEKGEAGNSWATRIKHSLNDEEFNDAVFRFKDAFGSYTEIKCNRVILSLASPVFKKQFLGSLKPKDDEPIDIVDGSVETFRDFIHFVYKEEPFDKYKKVDTAGKLTSLLDLAYFGHKYQVAVLSSYIMFVINNNLIIDGSNVVSILQDIEQYKLNLESEFHVIKTLCFNFMDNNMDIVFKTSPLKYEVRFSIFSR